VLQSLKSLNMEIQNLKVQCVVVERDGLADKRKETNFGSEVAAETVLGFYSPWFSLDLLDL